MLANKLIKLHLGCGQDYWKGYVNIDLDVKSKADVVADLCDIGAIYKTAEIEEVVMIHSLSYLRLWQARILFKDIFKLLKPGGRFVAEFPDLKKCAELILRGGDFYFKGLGGLYAFDERYISEKVKFTPYAYGWSALDLVKELRACGFFRAWVQDPQTHDNREWRDSRVEAFKV